MSTGLVKQISLLHERVSDWTKYPFNVPAIRSLGELTIRRPVVFFTGENGSGKSTLLEALAIQYGFGAEGGNRNFRSSTTDSVRSVEPLAKALRVGFSRRTGQGFFLRAESFFNTASAVDALGNTDAYGGRSLHAQSHGESFIALASSRFKRDGLYLLDEPEAALSAQRQLALLLIVHDLMKRSRAVQVIIATHSPILMAYPDAQILSFDNGSIHEIIYKESPPYELYSGFLANPDGYLRALFQEESVLHEIEDDRTEDHDQ
jgi:predicted ATPase